MAVEKARKQIASIANLDTRQTPTKRTFQTIQTQNRSSSRTSKNLPIAKAYEGSDSGEDIDSFNGPNPKENASVHQNLKVQLHKVQPNAKKSVYVPKVVTKAMSNSDTDSASSSASLNDEQHEQTVTVTDIKFRNNFPDTYNLVDRNGYPDERFAEHSSEHSNTSSDASSIIHRPTRKQDRNTHRNR